MMEDTGIKLESGCDVAVYINPMAHLHICSVRACGKEVTHYVRIGGGVAEYHKDVYTLAVFCDEHAREMAPIIAAWWDRVMEDLKKAGVERGK